MRRLKSNPGLWVLLVLLMGLIVVILVLPEVDLPDTAFYTNTAPAILHARVTPARAPLVWSATLMISLFLLSWEPGRAQLRPAVRSENNFLPILYRCLLC
jgi:hypothetical protein